MFYGRISGVAGVRMKKDYVPDNHYVFVGHPHDIISSNSPISALSPPIHR